MVAVDFRGRGGCSFHWNSCVARMCSRVLEEGVLLLWVFFCQNIFSRRVPAIRRAGGQHVFARCVRVFTSPAPAGGTGCRATWEG